MTRAVRAANDESRAAQPRFRFLFCWSGRRDRVGAQRSGCGQQREPLRTPRLHVNSMTPARWS